MENDRKKVIPSAKPFKVIKERPSTEVIISESETLTDPSIEDEEIKPKKKRRWWLWIIIIIILGGLSYFGYQAYAVAKKIITANNSGGSPFFKFGQDEQKKLQGEGDGRINILVLGIGGPGHDGADLTDTMMVVSVDPINKTVAMLSIPRDLWVKIPNNGESKINAVHAYGEQNKKKFTDGPTITKEVVSKMLDLPIHYYARMDFEGFKKLIDEVGGIDINVEKDIVDPYYPDDRTGKNITYRVKAGPQHMDGAAALKYARSRYTTSDFDRAKRQQAIIQALKEKSLSAGVMANPAKLSAIMNIIGDHFRTDMQLWEIERFMDLMKDVNTQEIAHRVLDNSTDGLLKDSNINGAYVLLPRVGNFNYSEIQALAHSIFMEPYILKEKARIEIQYPSKKSAEAKAAEARLKEFGYNVVSVVQAPAGSYPATEIFDYSNGGKPYTLELLKNRFKDAKMLSDNTSSRSDVDIVISLGDNFKEI